MDQPASSLVGLSSSAHPTILKRVFAPTWRLLLLVFALSLVAPPAAGQVANEKLVPAAFNPLHNLTDGQGFVWDMHQWGWVMQGTDSCFSQAFQLFVNNNQFRTVQPMMTADGGELVLAGYPIMPGLEVMRRCRVDGKSPGARFTEVFTNNNAVSVTLDVRIIVNSGNGGWQSTVSDSGQTNPAALGKQETGVVMCGMAQNGALSVALYLAGRSGTVRPALQPMGQPGFSYSLTVPPHRTAALVYGAAQCRINDPPDAKAVAALLKPFTGSSWLRDLPGGVRRAIVNLGGFSGDVGWEEVGLGKLLASLETNSGPTDILAFGSGTRLKGTATCGNFALETRFGTIKTSLDKIVALVGSRNHNGKAVVVFRDGQVLAGKLQMERFVFTLNTGLQFESPAQRLDQLIMRSVSSGTGGVSGDHAEKIENVIKTAMLQTTDGERIALAPAAKQIIALVSPWGRFEFPMDEVVRITALAEPLGHRVVLRDGTRLFGFLDAAPLALATQSFGTLRVSPLALQELRGLQEDESMDDPSHLAQPSVVLAGENVLIGKVELPALHIGTSGQTLAVPPNQIRKLRAAGEPGTNSDEAIFEAELWDGSKIAGKLAESVLPIRCRKALRDVPVRDVVEILVPSPSLSEPTRSKIAGLIRDLGSSKYAERKAAAVALAELGALAQPQLSETLQQTSDAEVRRSIQTILRESK